MGVLFRFDRDGRIKATAYGSNGGNRPLFGLRARAIGLGASLGEPDGGTHFHPVHYPDGVERCLTPSVGCAKALALGTDGENLDLGGLDCYYCPPLHHLAHPGTRH